MEIGVAHLVAAAVAGAATRSVDPRILELVFSFMRANPPAQNQIWCNEQILVAVTKVASPGANPADFASKLRYQVSDLRGMSRHAIIVSTR